MADKKITQLTALTGANAVAGDQLAIVDVSDTTMSASGTTKKIALSELQAAPLSAGTANGVAYLNGSKVVTTGSALTFDGTNLTVGGSAIEKITTNGNIVGTAGQTYVYSNGGSGSAVNAGFLLSGTDNTVRFYAANAEQMRLTSTGLGIGTSSITTGFKLDINGNARIGSGSAQGLEVQPGALTYISAYNRTTSAYVPLDVAGEYLRFSTNNGAEQMRLTSTGLGIGTSSPTAKLSIGGSNTPKLNLLVADGTERVFIDYTEATSVMRIDCDGDIAFRPNNTEVVRMSAFGSVGIGTSSPSASAILDVQSTTKGVRMPNMTTTQKNAIASPAAGLMVFDTTLAKLCVYTGAAWQTITSA